MGGMAGNQIGESKVVELKGGIIMQNMRNRNKLYRSISLSEDGAESFFEHLENVE